MMGIPMSDEVEKQGNVINIQLFVSVLADQRLRRSSLAECIISKLLSVFID